MSPGQIKKIEERSRELDAELYKNGNHSVGMETTGLESSRRGNLKPYACRTINKGGSFRALFGDIINFRKIHTWKFFSNVDGKEHEVTRFEDAADENNWRSLGE